jgi:hypothetical protein
MPLFDQAYFDETIFDTSLSGSEVSLFGAPQFQGDIVFICSLRSAALENQSECLLAVADDETDANYERQNLTGAASSIAATQGNDRRIGLVPGDDASKNLFTALTARVSNPASSAIMPSALALSGIQASHVEAVSIRRKNIAAVEQYRVEIAGSTQGFAVGSVVTPYFVPKNKIAGADVETDAPTVTVSIPSGYRDIKITALVRTDEVAVSSGLAVQVNSDATAANYDNQPVSGAGSSVDATQDLNSQILYKVPGASETAGVYGGGVTTVHEYTKTDRHKNLVSMAGLAGERVELSSMGYSSTDALSSLTFSVDGGANIVAGSLFVVEGIGKDVIGWEDQQVSIDTKVLVDWDNDGKYDGTYDNISADVTKGGIRGGRDVANALTGKVKAARCVLTVANDDDRYSPFNTSSVLTGNLAPKRAVKVRSEAPVVRDLFTGHIERIEPNVSNSGVKIARITCLGVFGQLTQNEVNIGYQASIGSGDAVDGILDAAGWPTADRAVDAGETTFENWDVDAIQTMEALRRAEESEPGLLVESKDGKVAFEGREHRQKLPHIVAQSEYSDDPTAKGVLRYEGIRELDPLRFIFNDFKATVHKKATNAGVTLWTHPEANTTGDAPVIEPGETVTYWAKYPNLASRTDGSGVSVWDALVATTDYTLNSTSDGTGADHTGDVTIVETDFSKSKKIEISNDAAVNIYLTKLKNDGTEVYELDPVTMQSEDTDSQTLYGRRSFARSDKAVWIPDTVAAQEWCDYMLSLYKDPSPMLGITVTGQKSLYHAIDILTRTVSDRIGIEADGSAGLGVNEDFFVESWSYDITPMRVVANFSLSSAAAFSAYWTLGYSLLGTETRLNPS